MFQATWFSFSVATLLQKSLDSDKNFPFWDCFRFSFGKFQIFVTHNIFLILSNGVPHSSIPFKFNLFCNFKMQTGSVILMMGNPGLECEPDVEVAVQNVAEPVSQQPSLG